MRPSKKLYLASRHANIHFHMPGYAELLGHLMKFAGAPTFTTVKLLPGVDRTKIEDGRGGVGKWISDDTLEIHKGSQGLRIESSDGKKRWFNIKDHPARGETNVTDH